MRRFSALRCVPFRGATCIAGCPVLMDDREMLCAALFCRVDLWNKAEGADADRSR